MQTLKPENWSSVHLPELEPTGREGGESRVTTGCPTRGLDWREQGLWNCPELLKSQVYVSAHISQPESSTRAESGPGLCPITDSLQHYHRRPFSQDWDRPVPDKNWSGRITECTVDNLDHGSGLLDSADELSSSRQSPVSSEELFSPWLEGKQSPLSHLETARIRCTPGREQARVCHLFSVKNGWLPLRKKGIRVHLPNFNSLLYQRQIELCIDSITHKHNKCKEEEKKVKDGKLDNNWSLSMSCRNRTFPSSLSTPNINETFNKVDIPAWLHRDGPPWSVWRGREVGMEGGTPALWGQNRFGASLRWAPTLQRATSVPDVLAGETRAGFSSISITSRKLSSTQIHRSHESLHTYPQPQPGRIARTLTEISASSSDHNMSSKSALEIQRASILKVTEDRYGSSVFDRVMLRRAGKRRAGMPEYRYNYTEGDRSQGTGHSSGSLPPARSFRSCLHVDLPLMSSSSILFLTKSLSISLGQAEDRNGRAHRSTLSLYVGRASHRRPPKTNREADCRISRFEQECAQKLDNQEADLGHSGGHPLQPWGCEVPEATCSDGANRQSTDSDTQRSTPELLSFREPGLSYTGASWQNGNADEKHYPPFSNFKHRHPTCNVNPGDFRTRGRQPQSEEREERKEKLGGSGKTPHVNNSLNAHIKFTRCFCRMDDISARLSRTLSLREALEQFRPDFISRSQGRLRSLQQRARRRRALQDPNPDMVHGLGGDMARHRGDNYTKPDPLSDNLFRPKERFISDQEMQLRSRRIYNKLPEVTKKKEEEKRKAVSQTNRLRAELFKKRLLNQLLQR